MIVPLGQRFHFSISKSTCFFWCRNIHWTLHVKLPHY